MKKTKMKKTSLLLLFLTTVGLGTVTQGQTLVNYESGPSNSEINAALEGSGVTITGGTLNAGVRDKQIALFSDGLAAGLEQDGNIFFGTGYNENILGRKNSNYTREVWDEDAEDYIDEGD